ncbi:hypothetical protein GCM10023188_06610 [Pontibacter saemangeumensis]|uniref:Uncharacterized protein n=1 Tax=Pontibacter saemangeumensis TaxID=1084525 RepID=A0ABP8LAP2_9BACT
MSEEGAALEHAGHRACFRGSAMSGKAMNRKAVGANAGLQGMHKFTNQFFHRKASQAELLKELSTKTALTFDF